MLSDQYLDLFFVLIFYLFLLKKLSAVLSRLKSKLELNIYVSHMIDNFVCF